MKPDSDGYSICIERNRGLYRTGSSYLGCFENWFSEEFGVFYSECGESLDKKNREQHIIAFTWHFIQPRTEYPQRGGRK